MRPILVLMTALLAHLTAGTSSATLPGACRRCHTVCGDVIAECVANAAASCPTAPRRRARRCLRRATRHCRRATIANCISSCRQTRSPVCEPPMPTACVPYLSTCSAVPLTPVQATGPFGDQLEYDFSAHTASPGPGGCCVIDGCAANTQYANAGGVNAYYREIIYINPINHQPDNGMINTKLGVTCPVPTPTDVYGLSDIYQVNFTIDPNVSLPPGPAEWPAPYVLTPGDLSVSIDSANDPVPSHRYNSFTPSTWRLLNQTVSVDKVCAEQQLMQGHATATFMKTDGTSCTVTIYSQGTRVVSGQ